MCLAFSAAQTCTQASISTTMSWNSSNAGTVTGYNLYYGSATQTYTNMVSAGNGTSATVTNLQPGKLYYFAATAHDSAGNESPKSSEAVVAGFKIGAGSGVWMNTLPDTMTNDVVNFSLGSGAPAGLSIDTNGYFSWNSSLSDANSTNLVAVNLTDLTHTNASFQATVVVTVLDSVLVTMPSVAVQTGQSTSLPLTTTASAGMTNLSFNVSWPGSKLLNPTLVINAPLTGGSLLNQGTNLVVHVWCSSGSIPAGLNQIGQINFQAATSQPSAFLKLPASNVAANKTDGSTVPFAWAGSGEAVVVGVNPLLRSGVDASQNRTLILYSNPGNTYQLQATTDISSPGGWQTTQTFSPSSVQQSVSVDSANPVVFYRLVK